MKIRSCLLLGLMLIVLQSCKITDSLIIPEEDLAGLSRPQVDRINPLGLYFNQTSFMLTVFGNFQADDEYTLYLNSHRIGSSRPNYWRYKISWRIPATITESLLTDAGTGPANVTVRVSSIVSHDISRDFNRYQNYISEPYRLIVHPGQRGFSKPKRLFEEWSHSQSPRLKHDGNGNLFLAWLEKPGTVDQLMFCFSRDGGSQWSQVLNISRSTSDVRSFDLSFSNQGPFLLAWSEENGSSSHIYFSRSLDFGETWFLPKKMNDDEELSRTPLMLVNDDGTIFLFWITAPVNGGSYVNRICLSTSHDDGRTWQRRIISEQDYPAGYPAAAKTSDGTLCLITAGQAGIDLYCSPDAGISWNVQTSGAAENFWRNVYASLIIDTDSKKYLIWATADTVGHSNENWIHFIRSSADGVAWENQQNIDNTCDTIGGGAAATVESGCITLVLNTSADSFVVKSTDAGTNWSYPEFIPESALSTSPSMVRYVNGMNILVYAVELRDSPGSRALYMTSWQPLSE